MLRYKVYGLTTNREIDINFRHIEEASDFYYTMLESEEYFRGYVMSNETGEVYAHFEKEICASSVTTTSYCARFWD